MKTHGRLAALGAYGVSAGAVALFALFAWVGRPVRGGGLDFEHGLITVVAVGVICAALIAAHIAMARQIQQYLRDSA